MCELVILNDGVLRTERDRDGVSESEGDEDTVVKETDGDVECESVTDARSANDKLLERENVWELAVSEYVCEKEVDKENAEE